MKDCIVKILPVNTDYLPAMYKLVGNYRNSSELFFDFDNCTFINASGLVISLIEVLKARNNISRQMAWSSNLNCHPEIERIASGLGFVRILNRYFCNQSMFFDDDKSLGNPLQQRTPQRHNLESHPIFHLDFTSTLNNKRDLLNGLRSWLISIIGPLHKKYNFHMTQFISIINEIAKNSADHSNGNALMGVDIQYSSYDEVEIKFAFGDTGIGIKNNIELTLEGQQTRRKKHFSLYEAYFWALTNGNTSKPKSPLNRGIGMTMIMKGSNGIGLDLFVFDAQSMACISKIKENMSHQALRKFFYNVGVRTGFYYYGVLKGKIRDGYN